jgi:S-adenosylmethionine-diacylgycerolhomoserine-N-methlytransferase
MRIAERMSRPTPHMAAETQPEGPAKEGDRAGEMRAGMSTTGDHGALMDRVYRHQRHFYDLTRKYYLFGRDRLIRDLKLRPGETLVEIGCGTARNLIAIAQRYPGVRLFGLDASSEMLRTAQAKVDKAVPDARIALRQAYAEALDASTFGSDTAPFDRVVFSYSLSMIPDWQAALSAAAAVVKPEGTIHIVDFGDLAGLPPVFRTALRSWLKLFHVEPRSEILATVEHSAGLAATELWISPGRYAFSWRSAPNFIARPQLGHVAPGSQQTPKA